MTREEMTAFFARRQDLWARRDAVGLARDNAEDGVVLSPLSGTLNGRAAIEAAYRSLFAMFPDWDFRSEDLMIDGDQVVQYFTATGTHRGDFFGHPASGKHFEIRGVRLYKFRGNQIAHERRIYDFTGLLIQIGVLKARPA